MPRPKRPRSAERKGANKVFEEWQQMGKRRWLSELTPEQLEAVRLRLGETPETVDEIEAAKQSRPR